MERWNIFEPHHLIIMAHQEGEHIDMHVGETEEEAAAIRERKTRLETAPFYSRRIFDPVQGCDLCLHIRGHDKSCAFFALVQILIFDLLVTCHVRAEFDETFERGATDFTAASTHFVTECQRLYHERFGLDLLNPIHLLQELITCTCSRCSLKPDNSYIFADVLYKSLELSFKFAATRFICIAENGREALKRVSLIPRVFGVIILVPFSHVIQPAVVAINHITVLSLITSCLNAESIVMDSNFVEFLVMVSLIQTAGVTLGDVVELSLQSTLKDIVEFTELHHSNFELQDFIYNNYYLLIRKYFLNRKLFGIRNRIITVRNSFMQQEFNPLATFLIKYKILPLILSTPKNSVSVINATHGYSLAFKDAFEGETLVKYWTERCFIETYDPEFRIKHSITNRISSADSVRMRMVLPDDLRRGMHRSHSVYLTPIQLLHAQVRRSCTLDPNLKISLETILEPLRQSNNENALRIVNFILGYCSVRAPLYFQNPCSFNNHASIAPVTLMSLKDTCISSFLRYFILLRASVLERQVDQITKVEMRVDQNPHVATLLSFLHTLCYRYGSISEGQLGLIISLLLDSHLIGCIFFPND